MCLSLYYKPDGYQFEIKSGLSFISSFLHVQYHIFTNNSQQDSGYLEDLDRIKTYIKGHFKEELHADLLARTLGMSRAALRSSTADPAPSKNLRTIIESVMPNIY